MMTVEFHEQLRFASFLFEKKATTSDNEMNSKDLQKIVHFASKQFLKHLH